MTSVTKKHEDLLDELLQDYASLHRLHRSSPQMT
jgi:hypothetical protein